MPSHLVHQIDKKIIVILPRIVIEVGSGVEALFVGLRVAKIFFYQ
jgi:hypothetical protein